ncbi:hypothetical protein [Streptosporangium sp. KLBMP 9127]|nr:hypothetical protein [Streptosporangium sp. KLBMP 9127]
MRSRISAFASSVAFTGLVAAGMMGMAAPGSAAVSHERAASGQLVLYKEPFVGPATTIIYTSCQPARNHQTASSIGAFDNRPLPGCQVVLINRVGATKVLCAGRSTVPADFRDAPQVRIQPGTAPACPIGAGSGV